MLGKNEVTFVTFLLYQLSEAWNISPSMVYRKLSEADAIDRYILPCYDTLHTLGSKYLVDDITELMDERGVIISQTSGTQVMSKHDLDIIYKQNLEPSIIEHLAKEKKIPQRKAMDIYYKSKLSEQIQAGLYGIENMDSKYLAEDLIENESELFAEYRCMG